MIGFFGVGWSVAWVWSYLDWVLILGIYVIDSIG